MKKGIWIPIVVLIVLGGGVAMAFALNGSDDIALTDDFTSSFLDPEVEIDEGFHYFQSEKNNFSMWFPAGYYLSDDPVQYESKRHFESLNMYEKNVNESGFRGHIQLNDQYEQLQTDEVTIYYGSSYFTLKDKKGVTYDPNDHFANRYFALVQSNDTEEFIVITYRLACKDGVACEINNEQESRFFDTLIQSIRFQK
ncbi:hypothetical protein [Shouchella clausii]|uniref:hypothetical protein n=1 Tax=Shouchella clausii TaxID=79880 RepID=UPI0032EBDF93